MCWFFSLKTYRLSNHHSTNCINLCYQRNNNMSRHVISLEDNISIGCCWKWTSILLEIVGKLRMFAGSPVVRIMRFCGVTLVEEEVKRLFLHVVCNFSLASLLCTPNSPLFLAISVSIHEERGCTEIATSIKVSRSLTTSHSLRKSFSRENVTKLTLLVLP